MIKSMTQNKERIKLLIEALESDEYEQGLRSLNKDNKFCCLGVACEIAIEHGLELHKFVRNVAPFNKGRVEYDETAAYLPLRAQEWYGIDESNPLLCWLDNSGRRYENSASFLNDRGISFKDIAAAFRRTYLESDEEKEK